MCVFVCVCVCVCVCKGGFVRENERVLTCFTASLVMPQSRKSSHSIAPSLLLLINMPLFPSQLFLFCPELVIPSLFSCLLSRVFSLVFSLLFSLSLSVYTSFGCNSLLVYSFLILLECGSTTTTTTEEDKQSLKRT